MHPLKSYLLSNSISLADFGQRIGDFRRGPRNKRRPMSLTTVSQIITGYRRPSLPTAVAIEKATGGAVTRAELLTWERSADTSVPAKAAS